MNASARNVKSSVCHTGKICSLDTKLTLPKNQFQKTVVAILDCFINPDWPYLPERKEEYEDDDEKDAVERAWSSVPDDPLNYHFLYHVLDADEHGHPPKINGARNPQFKQSSKSALHYIADSNNKV